MALNNPANNYPQIVDVQNPSTSHHVVMVRMPTNLASKWPSKPWGTSIADIGLSPKDAELYEGYTLVDIEPLKGSPDLYWMFQKLNGPEWTTKSIGQDSLIPAKFRRSVETIITNQDVDPATEPSPLEGDLIRSSIKQVENSGVAKLEDVSEIIDINADPLITPSTEDQLYVTSERIVDENTPSEEGFGIVQSSVQPLGNGKAVMTTKYAVNSYNGETEDFDIGFAPLEGNGFDSRYGLAINIEVQKVSVDDPLPIENPEFVDGDLTVVTRSPESVWHAKQEIKTYSLPEEQIWYGLRRATNFPKVLQEIRVLDSNENPALVPVFKPDIDGILKARWTRKFTYGPPELPDPAEIYNGRYYQTEEYIFLLEYERNSLSRTISVGNNNSTGTSTSLSTSISQGTSEQSSSSFNNGTSEQSQSGTNSSTSTSSSEGTGSQQSTVSSSSNSNTTSSNSGTQTSSNNGTSNSTSSGSGTSSNATTQSSSSTGSQTSSGDQTQTSNNTGNSTSTNTGTSESHVTTDSYNLGVQFSNSQGSERSETETTVEDKGVPLAGQPKLTRITETDTSSSGNSGSSGTQNGFTNSYSNGSSSSSSDTTSTNDGTSHTESTSQGTSTNSGTSNSNTTGSQTSNSSSTSSSSNVGSSSSFGTGNSTSVNNSVSDSSSISNSTSTTSGDSTSAGQSSGTTFSTNQSTSFGTSSSNSTSNNTSNSSSNSLSNSDTETTSIGSSVISLRIPSCLRDSIDFNLMGETYNIPATDPIDITRGDWIVEDIATNHWQDGIWVTEIVEVYIPA